MPPHTLTAPYDALMLASFGGPDGPDDVLPFLRNVTAGKGIPDERLAEVAEHYHHFGGASPINGQNLALQRALVDELERRGIDLPVVWGNRNWTPYTRDALAAAHADGARRVLALVTSAYSSYSGCRQYREDFWSSLDALATDLGETEHPLVVDKVRSYFNHPGFVAANVDAVTEAYAQVPDGARIVFVTHSIPDTMEAASAVSGATYSAQHLDVAADGRRRRSPSASGTRVEWDLAYCSRSGPPSQPWLEPDVNDHLEALAAAGTTAVVISPDRLHLRPHGGRVRPRHRGARDRGPAGPDGRARRHGRRAGGVRLRPRRPRRSSVPRSRGPIDSGEALPCRGHRR